MKSKSITPADLDERLKPIEETLAAIYASSIRIESTNKVYADMYKINGDNIQKLQKRVKKVEERLDIEIDPELEVLSFLNEP